LLNSLSRGYAVILAAEEEPGRAEELHELASVTRNDLDE